MLHLLLSAQVTRDGRPVCAFDRSHKLPYEKVVLACRSDVLAEFRAKGLAEQLVVRAVPHGSHSRKPPVAALLRPRLHWRAGLELFGRYLLPDTLTLGDQALKFQDEYFFRPPQPAPEQPKKP